MIKNKNEKGLEALYDKYSRFLLGIIVGIVGDKSVGEELLQKTMLKAWNSIESFDSEKAGLFTWLTTIARNTAIDKKRLKSFQNVQKTEQIKEHVLNIGTLQSTDSEIDAKRLLAGLDKKYKDVLDHIYLMGYSHAETSEILDIPLGTVKTRLRNAIKFLREELKSEKNLFLGVLLVIILLIMLL